MVELHSLMVSHCFIMNSLIRCCSVAEKKRCIRQLDYMRSIFFVSIEWARPNGSSVERNMNTVILTTYRGGSHLLADISKMSVLGISPVSSIQRACEQIAHHIIVNEVGGAGHVNNVNAICEMFRISRRNFYNLVKKLADDNIIEHLEGVIYITDYDRLKQEDQPVLDFFGNTI